MKYNWYEYLEDNKIVKEAIRNYKKEIVMHRFDYNQLAVEVLSEE